jgi:hypothetical protein
MLVFMTGLIYFNGCNEAVKRAYATDATESGHFASLWIDADLVEESGTDWWDDSRETHDVDGVDVVEFRIPDPAEIWFPDEGDAMSCIDLDGKLAKLKKKKQDGTEEEFDVSPAAQAIAEVTLRGGEIRPLRYKNMGLAQWTLAHPPSLAITAVLKDDASESGTITLKTADAEIVFSNTHNLFDVDKKTKEDAHAGDHVALFIALSPEPNVTVVSKKPTGSVGQLKTDNAILNKMRKNAHTEGETPGCCRG